MSVSGNLRTMELTELLQWLSQGKKTGTLIVDNGAVQKKIYFDKGKIVASGSTRPSEQLGHFLVSRGYITELELTRAIEMQSETGVLIGKILVSIGAIEEDELRRLLVFQTEESIYDLFTWEEGEFRFLDSETIDRGLIPLALDVTHVTLTGMKRVDDWNRIRRVMPDGNCIPVLFGGLELSTLSQAEQHVLGLIDDYRTLDEIVLESHSSEFQVCRVLLPYVEAGRVKIVRPRYFEPPSEDPDERDGTAPEAAAPAGATAVSDGGPINAERLLDEARRLLEQAEFKSATRHLRAARSLKPEDKSFGEQIKAVEQEIRKILEEGGLKLDAVPVLTSSFDELTKLSLTPEEGFILTRIDGVTSAAALLKVSPLDQLEGEILLYRLIEQGHMRLQ